MRVNVLGKQVLDFTTQEGHAVKGTNLFVTHPADGVDGVVCKKFFVNDKTEIPAGVDVGKTLDIYFNDKRKIDFIALAKV